MVSIASKAIIQRNMNGLPVSANDTVCVVHSAKNMIYTAFGSFSHNNTHAEITMINQLIANNDTGVLGMTVISVSNLNFVMPCPSCVSAFLKLNPVNSNTVIFTPNGYIPLLQILNQQPFMGYQQPVNLATPVQNFKDDTDDNSADVVVFDEGCDSEYLKNKLSKLLNDDDDDSLTNEKKSNEKKGFLGLFRKRNKQ